MGESDVVDYAVIGGGIAGLYCCYHLKKHLEGQEKKITLYEASDRLGGRIQTWRINPAAFRTPPLGNTPATHPTISELLREDERLTLLDAKLLKQEEALRAVGQLHATVYPEPLRDMFVAEFGPMRIEPDHQPYLRKLLDEIGIQEPSPSPWAQPKWSDLIPFPAYRGVPPTEPLFSLEGEEGQQTELIDLLLLALRRVFEVLKFKDVEDQDQDRPWKNKILDEFWWAIRQESFLYRRFWKRWLRQWINLLDDAQYEKIREHAIFRDTPLCDMGFWNLLSTVMSYMATVKIRDWGSFYHLLPENPSAAEWAIFWLRAIKSTDCLRGIRGGMDWIVHRLCGELGFKIYKDEIYEDEKIVQGENLTRLYPLYRNCDGAQVTLLCNKKLIKVEQQEDSNVSLSFESEPESLLARHVILALPKGPLQNIQIVSDKDVSRTLKVVFDSVVGFPLLKTFFIVKNPFWEDDRPVNHYAHTVPTRELHYSKSRDKTMGMMMLYTDRPGTQFWSDYLVEELKENKKNKDSDKGPLRELPHAVTWAWKNSPAEFNARIRRSEFQE